MEESLPVPMEEQERVESEWELPSGDGKPDFPFFAVFFGFFCLYLIRKMVKKRVKTGKKNGKREKSGYPSLHGNKAEQK